MVETFFLDWGFSFGAGVVFALAGTRERAPTPFASRAFRWGLVYVNIGLLAIAIAFYVLRPDWMWMYWVPSRALPVAVVVLAFALYEVMFVAGFTLGEALERARPRMGLVLAIAVGLALSTSEVVARTRLLHVGTRAQFGTGTAPVLVRFSPLRIEPLAWLMLGGVAVSTIAAVFLVVLVARRARAAGA